jgi:periplasmic divalent cation tolerance protein
MKRYKVGEVYIGWTTVSTEQDAYDLCNQLFEERLIACAQVSQPIQSIYQWNGEVKTEKEIKITLKFSGEKVEKVTKAIVGLHPYKLPQWIYLEAKSTAGYADWVDEQTQ